ncbi:hypothetical protein C5167_022077 [Papaver somniferum]|uniref:Peptidase S54 rhomboid domain-containing protein n=1 Tax=Papaver somniferum TaxID=3469 RepID=A0A4Y7JIE8_PAPSO|nr:RHOMBOID-like protein 12, mitochondrial [Papaver somniferum]RZC60326.1 hypothetical protein C5167_022077 [Papaver somniferum]
MQKLQLSFKLIARFPRNFSNVNTKASFQDFSVSTKKLILSSSLTGKTTGGELFSTTKFLSNGSSIPQKSHHNIIYDAFSANHLVLNPHLKNQSINRGILVARSSNLPGNSAGSNHQRYRTSSRKYSWFPSTDGVLWGLIVANTAVCTFWNGADPTFMKQNFMISVENFKSGRVHTMITSAFSHIDVGHLFSNMIGLLFFGSTIGRIFGPRFLLNLYLAGAIGGSVFYLVHHAFIDPSKRGRQGLGSSGAVNAIVLLYIFHFPKSKLYFYLVLPVPAMLAGAFLVGKDLYRMKMADGKISGEAHLGGAAVAAIAWFGIRRGWWI